MARAPSGISRHALLVAMALAPAARAVASDCASPRPEWLLCEDFEAGGLGWDAWFAQSPFVECSGCPGGTNDPGRIRLTDEAGAAHDGAWALYMPAEAAAGYRGASLTYRSCAGTKQPGCDPLLGHDTLYYRAWVRLAPDHQYVHHFMSLAGTRPHDYWDSDGNAGCRPNGTRAAGTTVDFNGSHELFFYTYFPEMHCDSGGYCSGDYAQQICDGCAAKDMPCSDGLECCWGNLFTAEPRPLLPRGEWVCLEMMMTLNTPLQADGEMAFWVNGVLGHRQTGMHWRDVAELQLNKVWVQHYIDSGDASQSNRIWWDDIVVSTARIGCGGPSDAGPGDDAANPVDATLAVDAAGSRDGSSGVDTASPADAASARDARGVDTASPADAASTRDADLHIDAAPAVDRAPFAPADAAPAAQVGRPGGCACRGTATVSARALGAGLASLLALAQQRRRRTRHSNERPPLSG